MNNSKRNRKAIQILVATHKAYDMPHSSIYLPIHVGREGKSDIGFIGDHEGDNISSKNSNYCELTALYWAWKNLECEYIGLSHYRRYFKGNGNSNSNAGKYSMIIEEDTVHELLNQYDIVLPKKRNYYIESVWNHYANAHYIDDLVVTKKIINEKYPEYIPAFEKVMSGKKIHLYNMFIMKKSQFDAYAEWLFDILFMLESKIKIDEYSPYQARVFGFISERLFNVWIYHHNLNTKELPILHLEPENKMKKITNFLGRKLKVGNIWG